MANMASILWVGVSLFIVGLVFTLYGLGGMCYGGNYELPANGSMPPQPPSSSSIPLFYTDCAHHGMPLVPLLTLVAGLACTIFALKKGGLNSKQVRMNQ